MINAQLKNYWSKEGWWVALDWKEFQKLWPLATDENKPDNAYGLLGPCRLSYEEVAALQLLGVELELMPLPGAMLTKMRDGNRSLWDSEIGHKDLMDGSAVQITVADNALLFIDEVELYEDCCTHLLQDKLEEGWRIIAVCPPNAQRRPDYILGRRKWKQDPFS